MQTDNTALLETVAKVRCLSIQEPGSPAQLQLLTRLRQFDPSDVRDAFFRLHFDGPGRAAEFTRALLSIPPDYLVGSAVSDLCGFFNRQVTPREILEAILAWYMQHGEATEYADELLRLVRLSRAEAQLPALVDATTVN